MCCYRKILKISFVDGTMNDEVLNQADTDFHFLKDMKKGKSEHGGHVMKDFSGLTHLTILENKVCEKKSRRRPRLTWKDDIKI